MAKAANLFDGCSDCGGIDMDCGLTDASIPGQWRLPNLRELHSLVHYGVLAPAVPNTAGTGQWAAEDPFSGVQSAVYWSSTSAAGASGLAWGVSMSGGVVSVPAKTESRNVWLVRGGQ